MYVDLFHDENILMHVYFSMPKKGHTKACRFLYTKNVPLIVNFFHDENVILKHVEFLHATNILLIHVDFICIKYFTNVC